MDRNKISILYKGPSIDFSYQVSVHLAEGFQRRRLKCEKLSYDKRRTPSDDGKSSRCLWQGELKKGASYRLYRKRPPRIVNRTIPKINVIVVHTVNRFPLMAEEIKMAKQLKGVVMPISQMSRPEKARKITAEEKKFSVFTALRQARAGSRLVGYREKKAKQKAEEEANKPKK
jgi:hypothetical protein